MQSHHPAQNNLALLYVRDAESATDYVRYAESAADKSTLRKNAEEWLEAAEEWLEAAAQKGNAAAQYNLYIRNTKKHLDWLQEAVAQNYVPALNQKFVDLVWVEENMEKDTIEREAKDTIEREAKDTIERVKKTAEQGDAVSQRNLGYCYEKGLFVEKDPEKALEWYKKAAEQGDALGNYNTGQCYREGRGVERDLEAAINYYFPAASENNIKAQNSLGVIYRVRYEETKEEIDLEMATRWYLRAAQQDHAIAQTNIGFYFSEGTSKTPQDYSEAYFWYSLALRANGKELSEANAPNHLRNTSKAQGELAKILDKKEKTEIDKRVEKWKPKQHAGSGTGFYIDKHHILTNAHVVIDSDEFRIPYRRVKLVTYDEDSDLALLYDPRENIEHATFRWNEPVKFGEKVSVFGYPQSHRLSYEGNITDGIVSGISDMIVVPTQFENRFQHTAPMQQGNSGGPVFDSAGNVIGVNVALMYARLEKFDDVPSIGTGIPYFLNIAQNTNFAIKSDVVRDFLIAKNIRSIPLKEPDIDIQFEDREDREVFDDPVTNDPYTIRPYTIRFEDLSKDIDKLSVEGTVELVAIPFEEITKEAKKFTVPIVCFKNKEDPPRKLQEIRIDDLVQE